MHLRQQNFFGWHAAKEINEAAQAGRGRCYQPPQDLLQHVD